MKRIYIALIVGLFLIGIAGAVTLDAFSKDSIQDKATKDKLTAIGITAPVYTNTYCTEDRCEYCGRQNIVSTCINELTGEEESCEVSYGTGCVTVPVRYCDTYDETEEFSECLHYTAYTETEQKNMQSEKVDAVLKKIAEVETARDTAIPTALGDATYTIKEGIVPK